MKEQLKDIQKLTSKDLQNYIVISQRSAERMHKDIKNEYGIKYVTIHHLKLYLKIK